jgi:aspartyl-tRNA(Asn)/glutamyl-tRNA(Gln) amidotransferase subunit A
MCRTVEDAALMLEAMAGYDPADPTTLNVPVPRYRDNLFQSTVKLRLGFPRKMYWEELDT